MTADQLTRLIIRELDWAPGSYQWECPACRASGNITPRMITVPSSTWHDCKEATRDG